MCNPSQACVTNKMTTENNIKGCSFEEGATLNANNGDVNNTTLGEVKIDNSVNLESANYGQVNVIKDLKTVDQSTATFHVHQNSNTFLQTAVARAGTSGNRMNPKQRENVQAIKSSEATKKKANENTKSANKKGAAALHGKQPKSQGNFGKNKKLHGTAVRTARPPLVPSQQGNVGKQTNPRRGKNKAPAYKASSNKAHSAACSKGFVKPNRGFSTSKFRGGGRSIRGGKRK